MTSAVNTLTSNVQVSTAASTVNTSAKSATSAGSDSVKDGAETLKTIIKGGGSSALKELLEELIELLASFSKNKLPKLEKVKSRKADATQEKEAGKTGEANAAGSSATSSAEAAEPAGTVIKEDGIYSSLNAVRNPDGTLSIYTEDGYVISTENKHQAWTIKDPEGKVTRIWGDPHVLESDGDTWDFKDQSTFIFGRNKVTIETTPAPNNQTYTSKITVYNHDSRATISGIDIDKPQLDVLKQDALIDDAARDDGDVFVLTKESRGVDDKFVLIKDVGTKYEDQFAQFAKQVGIGEKVVFDKLLTAEQKKMLGL